MPEKEPIAKRFIAYLEGLLPYFIAFVGVLGFISVIAFGWVMFSDNAAGIFGELFGTGTEGKKDTLEFLGWMISGFIAFFGLFAINKRATSQDKTNKLTEEKHVQDRRNAEDEKLAKEKSHVQDQRKAEDEKLAKEKSHVQDRFRAAIDHLSSKESSARIASFYEFFYLARDVPDYAENILGILCAHLRHTGNDEKSKQELTESQTLIDILFSSKAKNIFDNLSYDLRRTHLPKVDFKNMHKPKGEVNFSAADLSETVFDNTDLSGFNFQKANLHKAAFWGTDLQKADLWGANLRGANLFDANLSSAKLSGADLSSANLFDVNLSRAELSRTNFSGADLCGVDLSNTSLHSANLSKTYLYGTDLRRPDGLQETELSGAEYDEGTKFPEGFDPEKHGMKFYSPYDDHDNKK